MAEDEKRKDEDLDRQALLAEQRREEERLLQEEQQREKMEKIKAVEGKMDDYGEGWNTNGNLCVSLFHLISLQYCSKLTSASL